MNRLTTLSLALGAATALAGCAPLEEGVAEGVAPTYRATLTGSGVVGAGDMDGYATAELTIPDTFDQACYDLNNIRNLGTITGAHVHRGGPTVNGPVVIPLERNDQGGWSDCVTLTDWREENFETNPGAYYVQIHTAEYPNGAIRGQLRDD